MLRTRRRNQRQNKTRKDKYKDKDKDSERKPGGVAAYDGIGVVLVHRCSTGDAEDEENDHHIDNYLHKDDDNEHNSGINLKTLQPQRSTIIMILKMAMTIIMTTMMNMI